MTLSDVSIKRPVFTAMLSVLLIVLGVMGFNRLGTDLFPDVSLPVAVVNVVYPGAGPGEIETQVVEPIENAVAGISGIDKIHSFSRENVGIVIVQFKLTVDLQSAVQDVRDKVANVVGQLPKDAEAPVISKVDISASPVLTYAVSAQLPSAQLRQLIDDKLSPALAQIEGVAEARVVGGDEREIQVDIDLDKARAAGVSPAQVAQAIGMENLDLPAGRLELGPTELTVRTLGQFRSVEDLRALPVVSLRNGAQVRLEEIAAVTDGVADRRTYARLGGNEAVVLEIVKQPGSNTVLVSDQVKAKMATMGEVLGHGFTSSLIIDQSIDIRENAHEVWVALFFGGAMAILIILAFLLDLRGTIISSLALPTSVVGTFFVMYVLGYTLNMMTLLALSLAIGLLIDDAVVVREAITHRLEKGESPMSAAANGTRDVALAVLATTLSLVAVFIPVAFMPGIVGQFFKQFGITISAAVLISLFISFTLDPMLSARFAKQRRPGEVHRENAVARALRRVLDGSERMYERLLAWVLRHKWLTLGITALVIAVSVGASSRLGAEFMPVEDRSQFLVDLRLPDSASLEETSRRTAEAERLLRTIPEVRDAFSIVGLNGEVNRARLRVLTVGKDERERGMRDIKEDARALLVPGLAATRVTLMDPPILEGVGDFYPVMVRITGPDLGELRRQADKVAQLLRDTGAAADVTVDASPGKPELAVRIDRTRAGETGLSAAALAMQLRLALNGDVAGKLREGTEETDIRVRLSERDRGSPERIRQMELFTPTGLRTVGDVADITLQDGPAVVEHENRERQIAVYAQVARGHSLGALATQLKEAMAANPLPAGYSVIYDGQMKNMAEQNEAFGTAGLLAFVFIFMVLASQFESLKHPFTIMVSLPLALIGALLSLVLTGHNLSMGAMIGVILLMGLVTKNAILLVDGAIQHLREGDSVDQALLKAGPRRLRPILMTSAAMAIGMVPTAIGTGVGAEFRAPMAISVIGGVITSTFLTLLVVPVVFAGFERLRLPAFLRGKDAEGTAQPAEPPESERAA